MDRTRLFKALDILVNRNLIIKEKNGYYRFLEDGKKYVEGKCGYSWNYVVWFGKELWVRYNLQNPDSWTFIKIEDVTEEQFNDFCQFYEISFGPELYDVDNDVFEDI